MKIFILSILPAAAFAFLPQYYETAEVTPGEGSLLVSAAPSAYGYGLFDYYTGQGADIELSFRQGVTKDSALAFFGYAGGLIGLNAPGITLTSNPDIGILPNGGFGAQVEFLEKPSLAGQLSVEFPSLVSLTLLAGISSRKANREVVTFGLKSFLYYPSMAFVTIHPTQKLHISLGATILPMVGGEVHAGIAYTFLTKQGKGAK